MIVESNTRLILKKGQTIGPNGDVVEKGQSAVFSQTYPEGLTEYTRKTWNGKKWIISENQDINLSRQQVRERKLSF